MNKLKLEIDLPVFNEEKDLQKNIPIIYNFMQKNMNFYNWKIVIIDNGSNDKTHEICKLFKIKYINLDFIRIKEKGKGRALRTAWQKNKADIYSFMDIDLSTNLKDFPNLINSIGIEKYDIVIGSRLLKNSQVTRCIKREITSRGQAFIFKKFLGAKFSDSMCGFKAFNKKTITEVLPHILDQEWFFDAEFLFKSQKWGYKIKEIPITWIEDINTKVNTFKMAKNNLISILRTKLEFLTDRISPKEKTYE